MSVNLPGKFDSFLPGHCPWYICLSSAVQITRYIPLYLFIPDFWGWEGGKLEVVIPFENSQMEMGHQSNGPNLWAGKENLPSVSLVWSLEPPKLMVRDGGGKMSQGKPAGGVFVVPPWCRKAAGAPGWIGSGQLRVCVPKALPEAFLPYLRGSKPACPECSGLPGWAKGINTQHSMNLMYVSHTAFLISYIFIVEKSNKLQYH